MPSDHTRSAILAAAERLYADRHILQLLVRRVRRGRGGLERLHLLFRPQTQGW